VGFSSPHGHFQQPTRAVGWPPSSGVSKRGNEGGTEVADRLREYSWNIDTFGEVIWNVGLSAFNMVHLLTLNHNVYPTKIKISVDKCMIYIKKNTDTTF